MSDKINKKLVDQVALGELSKLLKQVSNPTIYSGDTGFSDFLLKTILTRSDLSVNNKILVVVNGSDNSNGIVLFSGYLTLGNTPVIRGINLGSIKITELGYRYDSSEKLSILISVKNEEEVQPVLTSLFVEVFYGKTDENGNKNRCSEINSTVLVDTDTIASIEDSESELKFSAIIVDKDGNELRIDLDSNEKYIDSIETAKLSEISDKLSKNIEISLNGAVTGNGEIDWTSSDDKFQLNINTELSESLELPLATSEKIGGIKIAVTDLGKNNHPVQLDEEGNAYVTFDSDIHRYKSMPEDAEIGDIVLYIGNSTSQFINGYFYKRAYTGFIFPLGDHFLPVTSAWLIRQNPITDYTFVAQKISKYDENRHELKPGDLKIELNVDTLVKDPEAEDPETADLLVDEEKTTFTITNGLYFSDVLTYKKIKEFGIELDLNYIKYSEEHSDLYPLSIRIDYNTNTSSWVQKNVQPALSVASALVYKGVTTWEELETKTATSEPGDFYTISDKHYQEYFFKNLKTVSTWEDQWEYMGEVFEANYVSSEQPGTKSVAVGGIANNTPVENITGKSVSEVLDMILFPDLEPTHTDESITLKYNNVTTTPISVMYGTTAPEKSKFSATTYRGVWNYYSGTNNNYAGEPGTITYSGTFTGVLKSNTNYLASVTFSTTNAGTPTTKKGVDRSSKKFSDSSNKTSNTITFNVWKPYFIGKVLAGYNPSNSEWFKGKTEDEAVKLISEQSVDASYTGLKSITGDVAGNNGHMFIAVPKDSPVKMYDPNFTSTPWSMKDKIPATGTLSNGSELDYDIYVKSDAGTDTSVYIKTS